MIVLEVTALSLRIEGNVVLRDVSLTVAPGEIVALLGRDGAGKTVCFEAINGLLPVEHGRILLNGMDVTSLPEEERALRGLSYLPEEVCIFRDMTVAENIEAALEMAEPEASRAERLEELLKSFSLEKLRNQLASTLSGGERRRCEVARAMATRPVVLIMDEPFRGLDPMAVREVRDAMLELKGRGIGLLVSDYDLHDLLEVVDRTYVLHGGTVVFSGPPAQLLTDPEVRRLYLGHAFEAQHHA